MKKNKDDNIDIEFYDDDEFEEKNKKPSFIRRLFFLTILIIIIVIIYSKYVGTSGLIIKEYPIKSNNITENLNGIKIAHFTCFHYGSTANLSELKNLVKEINLMKPDIVIFTGDLTNKGEKLSDDDVSNIIEELSKIKSTYGKYYVTGNHDKKNDKYYEIMDSSSFMNLDDGYDIIYKSVDDSILLTGLSLNSNAEFIENVINENKVTYKINIMHYPDQFDSIKKYNYDLVLAGHSHNGQISLPIYGGILIPDNAKKYYKPYYKIDNTEFYISSGIGTSNINYRFLNKPSFNFYRLEKK